MLRVANMKTNTTITSKSALLIMVLSLSMLANACTSNSGASSYLSLLQRKGSPREITAFSFNALTNPGLSSNIDGIINGTAISLTVPYGTDVSNLVATFTATGESVTVGSTVQESNVTPNDFTGPITYTVVPKKGTEKIYTVSVSIALSTSKEITAFSFRSDDNPLLSGDVTGVINGAAISITVPYGTDVTGLIADFSSSGTSVAVGSAVQTSRTTVNDFTGPTTYTVTAADSSTREYTATVTIARNDAKEIIAFSFKSVDNPVLAADVTGVINGSAISLTVPYGTDVSGLITDFSTTGVSVEVENAVQTSRTTANDFSGPVTYTVTADDSTTRDYIVTVTIALNSAKSITAFSFRSADNAVLSADVTGVINGSAISLTVPYGTAVTGLIADFSTTGASVEAGSVAQTSRITANDFSGPVTYTVTAEDSTTRDYTVTVTIALNSAKSIAAFSFRSADNAVLSADVTGVINGTAISLTVPYGTDVTGLIADFSTSGASVAVGGIAQTSRITANNFTSPVTYTVTAEDSTTRDYTVTVTIALNSAKNITAFSFRSADNGVLSADVTGVINGTIITLTVPYGTDVTGLIADFSTTGASVAVGGVLQTSRITSNDFTGHVTYTVTADDSTTLDYTVVVNISPSGSKNITAFSFRTADNPGLAADIIGTINGVNISLTVPWGTDVTDLVATFSTSGQSVIVGGVTQVSGATANDFTDPVTYRVIAADTTIRDYEVTVTIAVNTAKDITAYSFRSVDNPGLSADIQGVITGTDIAVTVPYGTVVTGLKAMFSTSGSSVKVGGVEQVSEITANDFTNPVTYTVTAADSSTKDFTVTVTVALNSAKDITAFSFKNTDNPGRLIDDITGAINGTAISLTVPPLTDLNGLVATFSTSGASVMVGGVPQTSGASPNDFTAPVTYTVTAADSSTRNYTVTVTVQIEVITWTQRTASGSPGWETIVSSDDGNRLAATSDHYVYTSADGGLTWETHSPSGSWIGIASSSNGLKLAAGLNGGLIYTSTDGGQSWTPQSNSGSHSWYGIASSADGMKLAACDYNSGYIYTSTDGGVTWTQRTTSGARKWSGISSSDDGMKLFACVQYGYVYNSTDGGATWTEHASVGGQFWWSCTSSYDGMKLAVIAYGGNMLTSNDGGSNWTNLGNRGWCAISVSADGSKYAACVWGGYVYFSNDYGVTWVQQTSAGYRNWDTITMSANGSRVAVGDYYGNIWTAE
jgi:photosystem II stability/assembly factor-like uncharacterized protein